VGSQRVRVMVCRSGVRVGELALGILRRGRLSDAEAVAAFSAIIALNYGWASFTTEMGAYGSDAHYDFALDQFLGGLRRAPR
jgi:hypothetical protein